MLTRGHIIGLVLDHFTELSERIAMRSRFNFLDLNVHVENYLRDLLNIVHGTELENLNKNSANEAGLDLGDEKAKRGIQITSRSDARKIRKTLENLTSDQRAKFSEIIVLVVGKKQGSYTLTDQIFTDYNFTESSIWDMTTIARDVVAMDSEALYRLHELVRKESARVLIELETPDEQGQYKTSGYEMWEQPPKPKITDGAAFIKFHEEEGGTVSAAEASAIREGLATLGRTLAGLPRITREFLVMLYEFREDDSSGRPHLQYGLVERMYRGDDLRGEIALLAHAGLLSISEGTHEHRSYEITLYLPGRSNYLDDGFLHYVEAKGLSLRKVIGEVDLSSF